MNHNIMEVVAIKNVLKGEAEMTYNTKKTGKEKITRILITIIITIMRHFGGNRHLVPPDSKHLFM